MFSASTIHKRSTSSSSSRAIFCVRMLVRHLSLSYPVLSQSQLRHTFFCIHCITSSIHVLLGRPLVLFPSNFPSRTSKALKPLKPLIACMSSIRRLLFHDIFLKCSSFLQLKLKQKSSDKNPTKINSNEKDHTAHFR